MKQSQLSIFQNNAISQTQQTHAKGGMNGINDDYPPGFDLNPLIW